MCGPEQRSALQNVRAAISNAATDSVEGFSYGLPAFLLNGKAIAGFSASAQHCSYFPMDGSTVAALAAELKRFDTSKGEAQENQFYALKALK